MSKTAGITSQMRGINRFLLERAGYGRMRMQILAQEPREQEVHRRRSLHSFQPALRPFLMQMQTAWVHPQYALNHNRMMSTRAQDEGEGAEEAELDSETSKELSMRFGLLGGYFTRQESLELVLNCKETLTDSDANVEMKLNYLLKQAGHKAANLIKTRCLAFSYKHIVMRHEFLIRAGLYRTFPFHKLQKQSFMTQTVISREKYFNPSDIVCTSDEDFLKKCTNNCLSLNELAAFEDVFEANYEKWGLDSIKTEESKHTDQYDDDDEKEDAASLEEKENDPTQTNNSSGHYKPKDLSEFYY